MPTIRATRERPAREPSGRTERDLDDPAGDLAPALARDFAAAESLDAALAGALGRVAAACDAAGGAVYLGDQAGGPLARRAAVGAGTGFEERLPAGTERFERRAAKRGAGSDETLLAIPIEAGGEPLGFLLLALDGDRAGPLDRQDEQLSGATAVIALAVLNGRLAAALARQESVRRDLALAADLQRGLLPESDFARCPVIGLNRPARQVSGDFFDFFWRADGRIAFALGDVAGKGVNAALLMAKAASLFRCLAKTSDDPAALLALLNREICETASHGMFVTMVAGIYDKRSGRVRFANAGHEPPLLRRTDRSYRTFPAEAPPLGILPELAFRTHEAELAGGEFYIFTDGLTEFSYAGGEMLGVDGLIQMLEAAAGMPLDARLADLLEELDGAGWEARDDLTVLAIDDGWVGRTPEAGAVGGANREAAAVLFEIRFPARADRLKIARAGVMAAARMCGFAEPAGRDIVLAVDEACQNVVRHAYGDDATGDIVLTLIRRRKELLVRLRDFAPPVDRSTIEPRPLCRVVPGGLGTHLIRSIMDRASYLEASDGRGNLLEMTKRTPDPMGEAHERAG